ncbi:MAG: TonB-dependent receptor [Desulfobacteraceae bacterium]|jgi:vitamin B12 transporter
MKQWVIRLVVVGLVLWVLPAWCEEVESSEIEVTVMETVVVTAGRVEEKKKDVTTNITVVTEEQIQESAAQDLGDLLSKQGFMTRQYSNSLSSVGIRGFRSDTNGNDLASHVLVLINGRRAGTGNLAKIMVDNVERVEIIRGPGSVQYGASAMGGVVNVITKKGQGKPSVYAQGALGSWNYYKAGAGASGQLADFDFSLSVSSESQDDYNTAQGDKYYNTGFDAKDSISVNAGWTFMPENRIGLTYTGYRGEGIGSPSYLSENDPDDYVDQAINTFDMVYDGQTTDGFLLWNLRYFNGKDEYETFDPENDGNEHSYFRDTDQQGGQAQLTAKWEHTHVTTGFDWTHYEIDNTYTTGQNKYDNPALSLMAKTKLLDDKLVLSAGGRHDWYEVESDDGRSIDETNWSTSMGVAYKLTPQLSVRANYAEAFRMPTANELYMYNDYSDWGWGIWSGNSDLEPEKSQTYEIGLDFSKETFSGGLTYFSTNFDDKIYYAYDSSADLTRYENIEGASISGIEGTLQFDIGDIFNWSCELVPYVSFTRLTQREDEENDSDLQYAPEWTASYGLRFARQDIGFVSKLNFAHTSEQDIIDYEGTGETTLDGYTVADLVISKTLLSFGKYGDVSIKADIRNLFDEEYALVQGYPMPGRNFFVGVKYVF